MYDSLLDPFDPNNWDAMFASQATEINHVYLDDRLTHAALIDPIDYEWAHRWRWCAKREPGGAVYARRAVGENAHGVRLRTFSIYLHVAIMRRMGKRRPSAKHVLVDHRNGESLDCRRRNLRWATPGMNRHNRFAYAPVDLVDDIMGVHVSSPDPLGASYTRFDGAPSRRQGPAP